jgi:hypothetical protein
MKVRRIQTVIAACFGLMVHMIDTRCAYADIFGSGVNAFTVNFVNVDNPGNNADTVTGYGAVPYIYRIGTYEISQEAIIKAKANGIANMSSVMNVTAGPWTGTQPAANISWYEAAAFVNWLNTSTGHQAAYSLNFNAEWNMSLWSSAEAWQAGGENLYRHKNAYYFLPSENEWYKAAYYNAVGANYYAYPMANGSYPAPVSGGIDSGTAVYNYAASSPAWITNAGGLSPYGTMGQGGNVWEWNETTFDGSNNDSSSYRSLRGGSYLSSVSLSRYSRRSSDPSNELQDIGFRIVSIPEPSTYSFALILVGAFYAWRLRFFQRLTEFAFRLGDERLYDKYVSQYSLFDVLNGQKACIPSARNGVRELGVSVEWR